MVDTMDCYTCRVNADLSSLPARDLIGVDGWWRVGHAFGTSLPGWLVLVPRRHVTRIADLTDAEAVRLGVWQVSLSRALEVVTGCTKTYIAQFAEAPGHHHVHLHVVPRQADLAEDLLGPGIFSLLGKTGDDALSAADMDALALDLRDQLSLSHTGVANEPPPVS
jgi:diadenosine tetraphosphate (Ap4A) HIT family hydrolase